MILVSESLQLVKPTEVSSMCWKSKPTNRVLKSTKRIQTCQSLTEPTSTITHPRLGMQLLNSITRLSSQIWEKVHQYLALCIREKCSNFLTIYLHLNAESFKANSGWLYCFGTRHGIWDISKLRMVPHCLDKWGSTVYKHVRRLPHYRTMAEKKDKKTTLHLLYMQQM